MAMPDFSAPARLELWQAAERRDRVERALMLAVAAEGGTTPTDEVAALPVGRRDARALVLHAALGGGTLEAAAPCPACGEQAEFAVDADALLARAAEPARPTPVEAAGFVVDWRCPDSRDVAAAAEAGDPVAAERVLLERCVIAATGPDGDLDATALPAEAREQLARTMAESDPLAEVLVAVSCPACETAFAADLDIGAFVWAELRADAQRLLREVDVLARAYGWTEADVLALDDRRRAAYL